MDRHSVDTRHSELASDCLVRWQLCRGARPGSGSVRPRRVSGLAEAARATGSETDRDAEAASAQRAARNAGATATSAGSEDLLKCDGDLR